MKDNKYLHIKALTKIKLIIFYFELKQFLKNLRKNSKHTWLKALKAIKQKELKTCSELLSKQLRYRRTVQK